MNKKFINVKKIVIPMLTAVVLILQVLPAYALSANDTVNLMHVAPEVEINYNTLSKNFVVVPNTESAKTQIKEIQKPKPTISGHDNWLGLYETYELNNFPVMREKLEAICNTSIDKDGIKKGMLYPNGQNSNYWNAIASNEIYNMLKKTEIQNKIKEAAKESFADITGNEWYADKLALATYYGVIAGKTGSNGKMIFDGSAPVTRAEFPTMLYRAMWQSGSIYNSSYTKEVSTSDWTKKYFGGHYWYVPYVYDFDTDLMIQVGEGLTKDNVNKPMTRLECAALIVNYFYKGQEPNNEASRYFKDVKNRGDVMREVGLIKDDGEMGYRAENASIKLLNELLKNPTKGVDYASYRVLGLAYEKGILRGSNGRANWNQNVTRAEAVQMIYNLTVKEARN